MKTKAEQFPVKNPNPVLSVGKDGIILYSNEAGEPLLYEWSVVVGEKPPQHIESVIHRVISRNNPERIEVKVGERVYLLAFHPLPEEECINIYGFDISDQKELEAKLRESEEKYRMLFKHSIDAIILTDPIDGGKILLANPAACRMLRSSEEELIGKGRNVMFDLQDPALSTLLTECARSGSVRAQLTYRRKNGTTFTGEVSTASFTDSNGEPRTVDIFRDITERKKSEEALQKIHDSLEVKVRERTAELEAAYTSLKESERHLAEAQRMAHIGNWEWNILTGKLYWSEEMFRIFGRDPRELAPDYNEFLNYVHPDDRDSAYNAIKNAIGGKPHSVVYRIVLANGEERTIYKQSEVILDGENNPIRIRGIAQDITERKKSEEALANIETARKQEIHHRIKNNLQVISSLLDLQAEQFKNRDCIKNSEILEAFKESQNRVISMALIHEELHKGDGFETLNFSPYIEELAENLFHTYRIGNSDISLKLDLEQNILFDMDTAVPLGIIVNELVSNSLKHAFPEGETGEITIKLHKAENGEQIDSLNKDCSITFKLSISDNGVGIDENLDIEYLDSLGLKLVTTLVDQLNGELELKRNNGTEFTIRFTITEKDNQGEKNMLYRKIPKNGDELSILGFGCMRLPMKEDHSIDENRAMSQVRYAIDHGVNYIDTGWMYHMEQSEPFLGRALAGGYREKVKVATKLPSWIVESREDMDNLLNAQLEKLQTGHIDYYLLHGLVGETWDKLEAFGVIDFLDKAKSDGRIINAGFSFHGSINDFKRIVDAYPWIFCQIQYNFMDEKHQAGTEGLKYAASKDLGVIVMEPLRGGNLANRVPPEVKEIWNEASAKRTPAEWALRWVWNHPEVVVVLSGMNEEAQVEENLKTANEAYPNSLTEAELQLVKKVEQKYRQLVRIGCTGCQYCMPCPSGVNIPECFEIDNNLHMFSNADEAKFMYVMRMGGITTNTEPEGLASQCIECGQCMEKCPQNLEIPNLLKAVAEELEGPDFEQRLAMLKQVFMKR